MIRLPLRLTAFICCCALAATALPLRAQTDIVRTVHNLTPGGPGAVKETRPTGLCVFCHTPHNASPQRSLWNRELAGFNYQLYTSSTQRGAPNQPSGTSRLCLSCHDGVLALGKLRNAPPGDALKLGPMTGPKSLGTDLSDDHPISFLYDGALAAKHPGLVDPGSLPKEIKLDSNKQVQCTSCHEPHEHRRAKFLRMDDGNGALCLTCHRPAGWAASAHATSTATWTGVGAKPWPSDAGATVASNACRNCHRSHMAGHGPRLMAAAVEADNCNNCHGGQVAQKNVTAEFTGGKASYHPVDRNDWVHDPQENPSSMPRHVTCADCHNAHAATARSTAGQIPGSLQGVSGTAVGGSALSVPTAEYQVCIKCHGFREPTVGGPIRAESTRIVSAKIDPGNQSYHPIAAPGRNAGIRGLLRGYTASSVIGCIDCHNNSDYSAGGTAPKGPHASRYAPILERNYSTADAVPESPAGYDLCYKCHDRAVLLRDQVGAFPHRRHVVDGKSSCAACHDAHGSRRNAHLVNFMLRDASGRTVVSATRQGRLDYTSVPGRRTCYLNCHGVEHGPLSY